jgi:hypothetical protein
MRSRSDPLVRILVVVLVCLLAIMVVGGVWLARTAKQAETNSERADRLSRVVRVLERNDRDTLRRAAFRICARDNLERAAIHAAYQQKVPPVDPAALEAEPILAFLLDSGAAQRRFFLDLTRKNLPILNCRPNLDGNPAEPLSTERQARFVARYLKKRLDPTPGDDVLPLEREVGDLGALGLSPSADRMLALARPRSTNGTPRRTPQQPRQGRGRHNPAPAPVRPPTPGTPPQTPPEAKPPRRDPPVTTPNEVPDLPGLIPEPLRPILCDVLPGVCVP